MKTDPMHSWMWQRLPLPIRRWCAPVARALVYAMEGAEHALRLRHQRDSMDPTTMRAEWLDEYANLHAFVRRAGEEDAALFARMQQTAIGGRMVTTEASIQAAVLEATGVAVRIRPSRPRVAQFDQLEMMAQGGRMFDFSYLTEEGEEIFENVPEAMRGHGARLPAHGAWGPLGMLIEVSEAFDETLERRITQAITDRIPAQAGFEFSWARRMTLSWTDTLDLADDGKACWDGFGEDAFGSSPFGGECEEFDVQGFGVDPFGENFGSRGPEKAARVRP